MRRANSDEYEGDDNGMIGNTEFKHGHIQYLPEMASYWRRKCVVKQIFRFDV